MNVDKQIEQYKLKCSLLGIEPLKIYQKNGLVIAELDDLKAVDCVIPNFVTGLSDFAFADCRELVRVVLPNSLKEIHTGAFAGCRKLKEITIPSNVRIIKPDAFKMCKSLEVLNIESDELVIEEYAFYNCRKLSTINICGGKITIPSKVFYGYSEADRIEEVYIGCNSLKLGDGVFNYCNKIIAPKRFKDILDEYEEILELY